MVNVIRITDSTFDGEVLASPIPLLIDFWASWCPPCKMVEPAVEALAREYAGRVKVAKLNVDQNPIQAARYEVSGLPTFVLFNSGDVLARRIGAQSKGQLRKMIADALTSIE